MNESKINSAPFIIIALILIIIAVIAFAMVQNNDSESISMNEDRETEEMIDPDQEMDMDSMEEDTPESNGSFLPYSQEAVTQADGDIVVFFSAEWCSKCQKLKDDIEKNASHIPGDVTILMADFDESTELKQKYGVTLQHTLVKINNDGEELDQWSGSSTLNDILASL